MSVPTKPGPDTICTCGHWWEEHRKGECGGCQAGGILNPVHPFVLDPDETTAEAIADRGGDPDRWPKWVKDDLGA
jgi:hypothetical protein